MKKEKTFVPSVDGASIFAYGCVSMAANYAAVWVYFVLQGILKNPMFNEVRQSPVLCCFLLTNIPMLAAAALTMIYLVKSKCVGDQYKHSEGKHHWMRNFLLFVLPGEAIRFLISLIDLGHGEGTGVITSVASFIFENTYVYRAGANTRIRMETRYIAADYIAYVGCYLVYLIVYCLILMLPYYLLWKKAEFERNELIRYQREDAQHEIQ